MKLIRRSSTADTLLSQTLHPLLTRIYASRGVTSPDELQDGLANLADYARLPNIEQAVLLLFNAINENKRITIIGDFDADGATSTAVILTALRQMGAQQVCYILPNRFKQGYGLSPEIVDLAQQQQTELLITVDNGISSHAGVERAHQYGMQVLITDHHLPGDTLPAADVIVNPNLANSSFPSSALAGVGVVFYVMLALRSFLREQHWFEKQGYPEPNLANLLDWVALGTVADVVPLDSNNRILVSQGLKRIRAGRTSAGILALLAISKRDYKTVVASDLAYAIAPKLNAAGRLEDMSLGVELLLEQDSTRAEQLAAQLNELNATRRELEKDMQQDALVFCEELSTQLTELPTGFVLYHTEWHQGLVGIVASRIKDQFHRPVFAFAPVGEGILKGSGRSIAGLHLKDVLEQLHLQSPDVMLSFGGHAMAAGVSLFESQLAAFQQQFLTLLESKLDSAILSGEILSDGELEPHYFNLETAQLLRYAAPWGQTFPAPLFDGEFKILQQKIVGTNHLKLLLESTDATGHCIDAIAFNVDLTQWPNLAANRVQIAFQLDINQFRGQQKLQLIIEHLKALVD